MFRKRRATFKAVEGGYLVVKAVTAFRSLVCQEVANNADGNGFACNNCTRNNFCKNEKKLINVYSNTVMIMHITSHIPLD